MNYNDEINRQIIFRSQQPTQVQEQNVGFGMNHFGQVIPIVTTQQHIFLNPNNPNPRPIMHIRGDEYNSPSTTYSNFYENRNLPSQIKKHVPPPKYIGEIHNPPIYNPPIYNPYLGYRYNPYTGLYY